MAVSGRLIQSAFQVAAAGLGTAIAGPLGGALGGFLGNALGKSATALTRNYAEKFGEDAGKKLFEIGADSLAEKLKNAEPDLAAAYREALRISVAEIGPPADGAFKDWFDHWNTCLRTNVPLDLDEIRPDQLDAAKLDDIFRQTMERLDAQGVAIEEKSQSLRLKIRTAPDALLAELKLRLPERFKENFQKLIDSDRYQAAWKQAKDVFDARLIALVISIAGGVEELGHKIDVLLGMGIKIDKILFWLDEEKCEQPAQLETPHEIPSPVEDFANRVADLQKLRDELGKNKKQTILIFGEAGLGKTELARRFAAEIGTGYSHGHIYFDLKGTSKSPVSSNELLSHLIQRLTSSGSGDGDHDSGAVNVEKLATRCRDVMHGKRVLLFLDNVLDSEQIRHVEPSPDRLLLITSHRNLDLRAAAALDLDPFSQPDSEKFLLGMLPRIHQHAPAIATLCGGLPFALRKAASTLSLRPDKDAGDYVRDLSSNLKARSSLAESVIATSYDLLSPPELKQQWCSLSCFADPFSREAMEAIWGLTTDAAEPVVDSLIKSSLLHFDEAQRCFYLHDLDRTFAQVNLENPQPYLGRHAAYFLGQLLVRRHPLELLDPIANDVFAAYGFCEQERMKRSLGSTVDMVREILNVDELEAAEAAYVIARLFKRKHRFAEAQGLYEMCRQVAVDAGCVWLEGACLRSMGEIHWILGNQPGANEYCKNAIERLSSKESHKSQKETCKSQKELIFTLHLNSERYLRDGLLGESEKAARESLEIRDQIGQKEREPLAGLSNGAIKLIAFLLQRNDLEAANKLLTLERKNLEGISLASTLGQVGCAMSGARRYVEADALLQDALRAYEGNDVGKGWIHRCLAELELQRGNIEDVRPHVEEALSIWAARSARGYEAYQIALTFIAALRFYYRANKAEQIASVAPQLTELYKQIERSDPSSKRKVAFAIAGLEGTLSSCGHYKEAGEVRIQRTRLEESIRKEEGSSSEVELLADRWGCDALAMAWPGQLLRLLSPRRLGDAKAKTTV